MIDGPQPAGLFVTGTDTNVGKTWMATLIVRQLRAAGLRVGAYKPVCSGAVVDPQGRVRWDDIDQLRAALGGDSFRNALSDEAICPQRFLAPLAPPLAARAEQRSVDARLLKTGADWWRGRADVLVVEGAGGLLSPVSEFQTVADVACDFSYPLIVVARCGLGTINHTLLTLEAARCRKLRVAGVVLNQARPDDDIALAADNAREIECHSGAPVLGIVAWGTTDGLQRDGRTVTIRWQSLTEPGSAPTGKGT